MSNLEERLDRLRTIASQYAKAEAQRAYLVEFRRSKKSMLMRQAEIEGEKTAAAQEREAYAHQEYRELLEGLKVATEEAVRLKWELEVARMGLEAWRTQQANMRAERKAYGA